MKTIRRLSVCAAICLVALAFLPAASAQEAELTENEQTAHRVINEFWNQGNVDVLGEIVTEGYMIHGPANGQSAAAAFEIAYMQATRAAFPDLVITVGHTMSDEDGVVLAWSVTGTQSGEYNGMPATGQTATVNGLTAFRFEDGKIAEAWTAWDRLDLLTQLGHIPAPGPANTSATTE